MNPIAPACQPSRSTANASTKGKLGRVILSIGTLKHASIVEYFNESNRSRCLNRPMPCYIVLAMKARRLRISSRFLAS